MKSHTEFTSVRAGASPASPERPGPPSRIGAVIAVAILSAAFVIPLLWLHRDSNRNLVSFHGTLHTAIAERFAEGGFPPENPFFAGEPVRYYWFYHWIGFLIAKALAIHSLYAFEILAVVSLVGLSVAGVALGRRLYGSSLAGALIAYLALVGSNGFGWIVALTKIGRDGTGILRGPATATVAPIFLQVQYGDHRFGPNFAYYLHVTSRSVSITLLMMVLVCLCGCLQNVRTGRAAVVAILTALCAAVNPLIGLPAGAALVAVLAGRALFASMGSACAEDRTRRAAVGVSLAALVVGMALALPTLSGLWATSGSTPGVRVDPFRWKLYAIVGINVGLLLVTAWIGQRNATASARAFLSLMGLGGGVLLVGAVVLALPGTIPPNGVIGNEHNLFNAAAVLLAAPAGGALFSRGRAALDCRSGLKLSRAVLLFLLFAPTPALILSAYCGRAPLPIRIDGTNLVWIPIESAQSRLYSWARGATSHDAVFVVDPDELPVPICNVADFPAFSGRALFVDRSSYMVEDYADFPLRLALATKLASGAALDPTEIDYLFKLNRPIYVVSYRAGDGERRKKLTAIHGDPVFRQDDIALFRWSDPRIDGKLREKT